MGDWTRNSVPSWNGLMAARRNGYFSTLRPDTAMWPEQSGWRQPGQQIVSRTCAQSWMH